MPGGPAVSERTAEDLLHACLDLFYRDQVAAVAVKLMHGARVFEEHAHVGRKLSVAELGDEECRGFRPGQRLQFLRNGYFCVDTEDSRPGAPVFNRTVTLKDTWAKIQKKG